jgi:hypothetical protein
MHISPISNQNSFKSVFVNGLYNYSDKQNEVIEIIKDSLENSKDVDKNGKTVYQKLSDRKKDIMLEQGRRKDEIKATIGKMRYVSGEDWTLTQPLYIDSFSKETAPEINNRIVQRQNDKRRTDLLVYSAMGLFLAAIIAFGTHTKKTAQQITKEIPEHIKKTNPVDSMLSKSDTITSIIKK